MGWEGGGETTKLQSSYTDEVSGKGVPEWKVQSNSNPMGFNSQENINQRYNSGGVHCFGAW